MSREKIAALVIDNGVLLQLNRTLDSLENQTEKSFEIKVIDMAEFWTADRNRIAFDADYVMYLYSGSVLEENAIEVLMRSISETPAPWLYFDERLFDAEVHVDFCVYEKPDFGAISFAGNVYTGEGVVFSREILNTMPLKYEGTHFTVALQEMAVTAAMQADAIHIRECLLVHHRRRDIFADEKTLLTDALKVYLAQRKLELLGEPKENSVGLYLYPKKSCKKVTIILMADSPLGLNDFRYKLRDDTIEVIQVTDDISYLEKIEIGAKAAKNDILCFMDGSCIPPSKEDLEKMRSYVSLPYIGIVSPCLDKDENIIYSGTFSQAGQQLRLLKTKENTQHLGLDIMDVRETSVPAWQFWMAEKELVIQLLQNIGKTVENKSLSAELAILECAFQARILNKRNLYVGNVLVRCKNDIPGNCSEGFCEMLFRWKDEFFLDSYCPVSTRYKMREDMLKGVRAYFPASMEPFDRGKKKVYVLTHELSLTGAPVVLSHAVRILKEAGWQVVVVSPVDGVLRKEFLREGVPVLVLGDMDQDTTWMQYAADFDLILVNTVVPFRQIEQLRDFHVPVMWWLHDARSGYENYLKNVLPDTLGNNIHTFSVSQYADDVVREFRPKYQTDLLLYGLKDEAERVAAELHPIEDVKGRKIFVSVGTVIHRKGQDILTQAVRLLTDDIRKQCLFLFVGKCIDADIFQYVKELEKDYPDQVRQIDAIPHDDIYNLYKQAAAVICSSRDDPLPTFMAETMMVSGVCICSEHTGTAGIIENGKNGYVYKNDDPADLAQCIRYVVEHDDLDDLRKQSRETFENVFSMDIFRQNLLNCVARCINRSEGDYENE